MKPARLRSAAGAFVALAVALSSLAAVSSASVAAKPAGKPKPPNQRFYTLSVRLKANRHGERLDTQSRTTSDYDSAFGGTSLRFLLVRQGTAAKPQYTIRAPLQLPGSLYVSGFLDYSGRNIQTYFPSGNYKGCRSIASMRIDGDNGARVRVFLANNRLGLSIASSVAVRADFSGCGHAETEVWPNGTGLNLALERTGYAESKPGPIDPKLVRFGRSFSLARLDSGLVNPDLYEEFEGGFASMTYEWSLEFRPAGAR